MIKYFLFIALLCGFSTALQSQSVGIRTVNPMSVFHLDSQGDNDGGGGFSDDVVVNALGNLAIGTRTAPANAKVTVANGSTLMIRGGVVSEGKALISDAVGNASWGNVVGANGIFLACVHING